MAQQTIGSGPDTLVLKISEDAYQGDAQYTVKVDGVQMGGTFTAQTLHSTGQSDTLTLNGDWSPGAHRVEMDFLNDAWGGTAAADRNFYVDGAAYDGAAVSGAGLSLLSAGPQSFGFTDTGGTTAPPPPSGGTPQPVSLQAGSGPDALVLRISQDAYQGSAQYTVRVDGVQVGGTFTAAALHGSGQSDTLTLNGDWSPGAHRVEMDFLNDAWGGTAAADRNFYVDGAAYDGAAVSGAGLSLLSAGPQSFGFTDTGGTTAPPPPSGGGGGGGAPFPTNVTPTYAEEFNTGWGGWYHTWQSEEGVQQTGRGTLLIGGSSQVGSGIMPEPPGNPAAGFGDGLYQIRARMEGPGLGSGSGPALVIWPADDRWPGPEIDIGEIGGGGDVYMATHWNNGGRDAYNIYSAPGVDWRQWHEYAALLETNRITYYVDGRQIGVETQHPAPEYGKGGVNHLPSLMNRSSETLLEVDYFRFTDESVLA